MRHLRQYIIHLQPYFTENQGEINILAKNERKPQNQGKSGIYAKTSFQYKNSAKQAKSYQSKTAKSAKIGPKN